MRRTVLSLVALVVLVFAAPAVAAPRWGAEQLQWEASGPVAHDGGPAPGAGLEPCDEVPGGLCGRVEVALDRDRPTGAQIGIFFAVFPHTDDSARVGRPIFATFGGPGVSATQGGGEGFVNELFGPLRGSRDVVLIDYRGTGLSDAIDCPPLQAGAGDFYENVRLCGEQLGDTSDLYGSEDVAADIEAVRDALDVKRFDFYGLSYAAADLQAYGVRHPHRLGTVVLDSPFSLVDFDPWATDVARNIPTLVNTICRRSDNCRRDHPRASEDLAWLAKRLRMAPVDGTAFDSLGDPHTLHVDEAMLVRLMLGDFGGFTAQSEVAAAARALRRGDPAPLLRLAAETFLTFPPPPPEMFSAGLLSARFCTDQLFQWDPLASFDERRRQFDAARSMLDPRQFAPFSVDGWAAPAPLGSFQPDPCIGWPAPTHDRERPIPDDAKHVRAPALILAAEYDIFLPRAIVEDVREIFPNSRLIDVAGSTHVAAFGPNGDCARALIQRFLATDRVGDASCAARPAYAFPGVGRFARTSADMRPAMKASPDDRSTRADRKLAAAAAATVVDAFRRFFIAGPSDHAMGLRGGLMTSTEDDVGATIDLGLYRFVEDLAVTGRGTYDFETGAIDANLALVVAGSFGQLQVSGVWFAPGATTIRIDGQIGGRRVVAEVPAT
jgi:pimeloyl-ACP methyl ester carboxylesterase